MRLASILMVKTIGARPAEKVQGSGGHFSMEGPELDMPLPCWDVEPGVLSSGAFNKKLRVQWLGVDREWYPVEAGTNELHGMSRDSPVHTINKPLPI